MALNAHVITKSKNNLLKINDNDHHESSLELKHKLQELEKQDVLLTKHTELKHTTGDNQSRTLKSEYAFQQHSSVPKDGLD